MERDAGDMAASVTGFARARLAAGVGLLLLYALPLFAPPRSYPIAPPAPDAGLMARVFQRVPPWWMGGRLLALLAGAVLVASVAPRRRRTRRRFAAVDREPVGRVAQRAALVAAAAHVAALPWIGLLPPLGQLLYVAWPLLPATLLARRRRSIASPGASRSRIPAAAVAALVGGWVAVRLAVTWDSPRVANLVDMWRSFTALGRLTAKGANFLISSIDPVLPGVNATPLLFQGLPLLQVSGHSPGLLWVQVANTAWLAVAGVLVARLAAVLTGPAGGIVATAAFLFSPFALLAQMSPTGFFIGPLLAACIGVFLVDFLRSGSAAALTLLGGAAGIAITWPALAPAAALAVGVAASRCWRGSPVPWTAIAVASLAFVAEAVPGVPSLAAAREMQRLYAAPHGHAATLEAVVFGQLPALSGATRGWALGAPGPLDVPIAVLLLPFAASRTAMRLLGDAAFEPVGASLAAAGLGLCARHATRDPLALALVAFLGATLVPAFISSTDTPSLLRIFGAPVPLALLTAVGFAGLRRAMPIAARRHAAVAALFAIVVGGTVLFDVVGPRILADSSTGLVLRSVDAASTWRAAVLTRKGEDQPWLYVREILRGAPRSPIPVILAEPFLNGDRPETAGGRDLLLWSPGVGGLADIGSRLCTHWPHAVLFTIADRVGLSHIHAAYLAGPGWTPAVPRGQWTAVSCNELAGGPPLAARTGPTSAR